MEEHAPIPTQAVTDQVRLGPPVRLEPLLSISQCYKQAGHRRQQFEQGSYRERAKHYDL